MKMIHCGYCKESGHNIRSCKNEYIAVLLFKLRIKTYYSKQQNTFIILFEWLLTLTTIELKVLLLKSFNMCCSLSDQSIAIIMEQQFSELEDTFWKKSLPSGFVSKQSINNSTEKDLLICKIQILYEYSTEYLEKFSNNHLFDLYVECKNKEKWNIRLLFDDIVRNDESKDCGICLESVSNNSIVTYNCKHEFCNKCVRKYLDCCSKMGSHPICAFCRTNISTTTKYIKQT